MPAWATIAFDAFSTSGGEADPNWTHTPTGTPRGVVVCVVYGSAGSISGITYGGTTMSIIANVNHNTGETAQVGCYFLGSSVPTGAQTVAVNLGGGLGQGYAFTYTAAADTEVVDSDATINSDSLANPSVTLSLAGHTSAALIVFGSGQNAVTGVTPLTGWTAQGEQDNGTQVAGEYTYNTIGSSDVTAGWTQTAEDAVAVAVAVSEVGGTPTPCSSRIALIGVGCK